MRHGDRLTAGRRHSSISARRPGARQSRFWRRTRNSPRIWRRPRGKSQPSAICKSFSARAYPPTPVEFSGITRAPKAPNPDIVYVASYPPDSAGILRAVNEIGIGDDVKIFGGGMVGLQFGAGMDNLGSLLNGVVNFNTWLPEQSMYFDGTKDFFDKYTKR